jgi:dCMP deaminase
VSGDVRRKLTLSGWADLQWGADQVIEWDELWMNTAELVSRRSRCSRDRVGAVIVSADNVMLSVGFNGAPANYAVEGMCSGWCPRAQSGCEPKAPDYSDCFAIHAESNCVLRLPGRPVDHVGASLYVNSTICWDCARFIASTNISRVLMNVKPRELRRQPEDVIELLQQCGVEVILWQDRESKYRRIFLNANGLGPHECHFCKSMMPLVEAVHHVDGDHDNNEETNLSAAHASCHTSHHRKGHVQTREQIVKVHGPRVKCPTCGIESTRAGMGRHRSARGH